MQHKFYTNELFVKTNRSLKARGQIALEMEVERAQMHKVLPLEEYPEGTHFIVIIEPYEQQPME